MGGKMGTDDMVAWREIRKNRIQLSAVSLLRCPYRSPNTSVSLVRPSTYFRGHPEGWAGLRDLAGMKRLPFLNNRCLYVMTAVDTAVWCAWKLLMRVNPKSSEGKQNVCNYMRRWMLTYCGNHFMICRSQVIMLCTSQTYTALYAIIPQ